METSNPNSTKKERKKKRRKEKKKKKEKKEEQFSQEIRFFQIFLTQVMLTTVWEKS